MPRPIRASIDLKALRHNHSVAKRHAGNARLWSVIKADAYGHGLVRVASALEDVTDGFALLDLRDAFELRDEGIRKPILMLEGPFAEVDLPVMAEYSLTSVIHSEHQLEMLRRCPLPFKLDVYLKLNTGMNRLGFRPEAFPAVLAGLRSLRHVGEITLMTHLADADNERGVAEQLNLFEQVRRGARLPVSLANSAALLRFPEAQRDWVRPGIMLYGSSPFPSMRTASALGLKPVMTLTSEIIGVQEILAGERVGYGGLFQATGPTRVGVVACGYADGYPRHAPTGTPIIVDGQRTRTLGRVSMDMMAVDLSAIPGSDVGSRVVLWGEGLSADEVATASGTVSYELFCALAPRVPVTEA
jgi:alanine racemase